jgi:hypothetical protein
MHQILTSLPPMLAIEYGVSAEDIGRMSLVHVSLSKLLLI